MGFWGVKVGAPFGLAEEGALCLMWPQIGRGSREQRLFQQFPFVLNSTATGRLQTWPHMTPPRLLSTLEALSPPLLPQRGPHIRPITAGQTEFALALTLVAGGRG